MKKFGLRLSVLCWFLFSCIQVDAQKLPNVQQTSLRAPANIKIDGKATEWGNKFQAFNRATEVFYTIANDDDKLYLIIQAPNPDIINKIILGGITFTVNGSGKKDDKKSVVITFPTFYKNERPKMNLKHKPELTKDTIINKMRTDSFMRVINIELADKSRMIEIEGAKSIADSLISVYNEEGIKAIALFDNQINYTSKLAVPIKYFNLSTDTPVKFYYNIKLNGASANNATI